MIEDIFTRLKTRKPIGQEEIIEFLYEQKILLDHVECPQCEIEMVKYRDKTKTDKYRWVCKKCIRHLSIRAQSVLIGMKLELNIVLACWAGFSENLSISELIEELELTRATCIRVYTQLRQRCTYYFDIQSKQIPECDKNFIKENNIHYYGKTDKLSTCEWTDDAIYAITTYGRYGTFEGMKRNMLKEVLLKTVEEDKQANISTIPFYMTYIVEIGFPEKKKVRNIKSWECPEKYRLASIVYFHNRLLNTARLLFGRSSVLITEYISEICYRSRCNYLSPVDAFEFILSMNRIGFDKNSDIE